MEITKVCVLGAGIMGAGIAQVIAEAGCQVAIRDIETSFVEKGISTIKSNLDRAVSKGKKEASEAEAVMKRIKGTTDLKEAAQDCHLVIEAVVEIMDVKKQVFKELDSICPASTLFASNTSGLSITEMASVTKRPDRFIGMHFFNPVPVMKLVELIRGFATSDETYQTAKNFVEKIGKTPVEVNDPPAS